MRFSVPTAKGSLVFGPGIGQCVAAGCGVKGGGLLEVEVYCIGKADARVVLCGNHISIALALAVGDDPDEELRAEWRGYYSK